MMPTSGSPMVRRGGRRSVSSQSTNSSTRAIADKLVVIEDEPCVLWPVDQFLGKELRKETGELLRLLGHPNSLV